MRKRRPPTKHDLRAVVSALGFAVILDAIQTRRLDLNERTRKLAANAAASSSTTPQRADIIGRAQGFGAALSVAGIAVMGSKRACRLVEAGPAPKL
jgi:hypothetical protein